ncbi:alpha/beta fold hydrolase [Aggregatilineales bacterium SYSU G02658]
MQTISFGRAFEAEQFRRYQATGTTGRAWLLIHGFPGTPAEMRPIADALTTQGDSVDCLLLPGFGPEIDRINDYTVEDWLSAAREAFTALQAAHSQVGLIGLSMGGALSVKLAAEVRPQMLILLAPFWQLEHVLWRALPVLRHVVPQFKPFRLFKPDWNDPKFRESVNNFMPGADLQDAATREAILNFSVPVRLFDQIRRAGLMGAEAAPQVTCSTLIIQGQDDELVRPHVTRAYLNLFRSAPQYVELPGPHTLTDVTLPGWPAILQEIQHFIAEKSLEQSHA